MPAGYLLLEAGKENIICYQPHGILSHNMPLLSLRPINANHFYVMTQYIVLSTAYSSMFLFSITNN